MNDWAVTVCSCAKRLVSRRLVTLDVASGPGGLRLRKARILTRVLALRTLSLSVPAHVDADALRVLLDRICRSAVPRGGGRADEAGNVLQEYGFLGMLIVDDGSGMQRIVLWCASPDRRGEKRALEIRVAVIGSYGTFGNTLLGLTRRNRSRLTLG
ncbi:hypothetical protein EDB86DRAFT_2834820 [Lactarius hatsudake]|nr:hypothetical protein EDB86DRAFT_2834820 [Lactarius hatsudake]